MSTVARQFLSTVLKKNENNFDLLRLIAAVGVIIGHAYAIAPEPPLRDGVISILHFDFSGSLAVKFFFFLSGLLVTDSIVKRPEPIKFLVRRSFRIFPGLIACLLFTVFIVGPIYTRLTIYDYFQQRETWTYFANNIKLFNLQHKINSVIDGQYGLNGSLWTLQYEFLCYVFVALCCGAAVFRNRQLASAVFIGITVIAFVAPQYLPWFSHKPDSFLLPACFSIGALFAINRNFLMIDLRIVLILWLVDYFSDGMSAHIFLFYVAFFYTAVYLATRKIVVTRLKLPFDPSYGVYLYGFLIQQCVHASWPDIGVHGNQIASMLIAFIIGIVSWYFVEKPALNFGAQFTSKN
jgi:peptidoglycan/LPS O-acetylase OafA/YrhL